MAATVRLSLSLSLPLGISFIPVKARDLGEVNDYFFVLPSCTSVSLLEGLLKGLLEGLLKGLLKVLPKALARLISIRRTGVHPKHQAREQR